MAIKTFPSTRHSFVSIVLYRDHHGWIRRKIFKLNVLRKSENAILRLVFANLNKYCVVFNSSKLTDFVNVLTQFYLNFLKLQELGVLHPHTPTPHIPRSLWP